MKIAIILLVSSIGFFLVIRGFIRNIQEIRNKPTGSHTITDRFFNYPLMVVWYGYLLVFFVGLVVNNLIIK
ncbi:hypothetical protein ACFL5V_04225 [Fibrobacterota bacterium]